MLFGEVVAVFRLWEPYGTNKYTPKFYIRNQFLPHRRHNTSLLRSPIVQCCLLWEQYGTHKYTLKYNWFFMMPSITTKFQYVNSPLFIFPSYSLHVSAPTGHPQVRFTIRCFQWLFLLQRIRCTYTTWRMPILVARPVVPNTCYQT
jgi:hypothetical protein